MLPVALAAVAPRLSSAGALNRAPLAGLVSATVTPLKPLSVNTQSAGMLALKVPLLTVTRPP